MGVHAFKDQNSGQPSRRLLFVLVLLLAGCLMALYGSGVAMASPTTTLVLTIDRSRALLNGDSVGLDTAPVIDEGSGRTLVPVRFIGDSLGAYVGWDGDAQKVTYLTGDTRIELWVGQTTAKVNGQSVDLDVAPYVDSNNRTLVPLRFVSQQFGAQVDWDPDARVATITAPWVGRVVVLKGTQFSPADLTITAGSRVTWVNLDPMVHNVWGSDFNSPTLSYLQAFSHRFDSTGMFHYRCTIHPGMTGQITVQ
jgi:plastocyanin